MKTHPVSAEELMAYLDGETKAGREQVARHLEGCVVCQQVASDLRSVAGDLREWTVDTEAEEMTETLLEALRTRKPRVSRWLRRPAVLSAVALAAVLVMVLAIKRPHVQNFDAPDRPLTPMRMARGEMAAPEFNAAPAPPAMPLMIVRTAQLTVTAANLDGARSEMDKILNQFGGHLAELTVNSAPGAARNLTASLRIPSSQLDAALAALRKLGHVDSETQSGEEVTQRYVDIDARLNNSRRTEERLQAILKTQTGKLSDVLAVEEQLDKVRGEIERTEAEQKQLNNQIALATVGLTVNEQYKQPLLGNDSSIPIQIRNAAVNGFRTAAHDVISAALWLLEAGPSLVLIALVLFFPARLLWRRVRYSPGS